MEKAKANGFFAKHKAKLMLSTLVLILGAALAYTLSNSESKSVSKEKISKPAGIYTCAMHPSVRMEKPGKCPICGMDLTFSEFSDEHKGHEHMKAAQAKSTKEEVVDYYTCGMHPSVKSEKPGKCPICGHLVTVEPDGLFGDARCPSCGNLLWIFHLPAGPVVFDKTPGLEQKVLDIISKNLGVPKEAITFDTTFILDLGMDSLDIVELVMEFEDPEEGDDP